MVARSSSQRPRSEGSAAASDEDIEELLRRAGEADAAAAATLPSAAKERAVIDAAEALAGSDAGVPPKSRAAIIALENKWMDFLGRHGDEYGFSEAEGPTLELAKKFSTWGFFNRKVFSTTGCDGMGDSWGLLAVPYLLPKYVFVRCGYPGWAGLDRDALQAKCRPFLAELRENWQKLKVSNKRSGSGNDRVLKKERWTDGLLSTWRRTHVWPSSSVSTAL